MRAIITWFWVVIILALATGYLYFDPDNWRLRPPPPRAPFVVIVSQMRGWCPGTPGLLRYLVLEDDGAVLGDGYCYSGPSRIR